MQRADLERIREELAWLDMEPAPDRCGCRDVRCSEQEGHPRSECPLEPELRIWTHRWEYLCTRCREYYFGGTRDGLS